jgi:putative toxin-antitoxin system antitoxin component (TIGR02293 family)
MATTTFITKHIPARVTPSLVLGSIGKKRFDRRYFIAFKHLSTLPDTELADKLNINVKTLRRYRNHTVEVKKPLQEHVIILASLLKHGLEVFGDKEKLTEWLTKKNLLLDGNSPIDFLDTISGIQFVEDRLIAIEYGDNV